MRLADYVDADRLWQRHLQLARFGATANGGVNRQALSEEDIAARRQLIEWGTAIGASAFGDAAGNLFLRFEGASAAARPILTGSHIDSQPTGGKFDGAFGVLAGLEAIQAMHDVGFTPARPVEVVAWMNEEGSRFAPGMMGSRVFAGASALDTILSVCDAAGTSVEEALARVKLAFPDLPSRIQVTPAAYVEAHIEQGPLLERSRVTIGVVSGLQGKRTFRVDVTGEPAHAGTTPRSERKDALMAAVRMAAALADSLSDAEDLLRFTIGAFDVSPNAPSVVPGSVSFSIDLRHPDPDTLRVAGDRVGTLCAPLASPCSVSVRELSTAMPIEFPAAMRERIAAAAHRLALTSMEILSSAGHDARFLHDLCPTGMIFVPCKDGISHNEAESATPDDLADGARVLTEVLAQLAANDGPRFER